MHPGSSLEQSVQPVKAIGVTEVTATYYEDRLRGLVIARDLVHSSKDKINGMINVDMLRE